MDAPPQIRFELARFEALDVGQTRILARIEGQWLGSPVGILGDPLMVVDGPRGIQRAAPLPASGPQASGSEPAVPWRAAYALDADLVERAAFALALETGALFDLPAPRWRTLGAASPAAPETESERAASTEPGPDP